MGHAEAADSDRAGFYGFGNRVLVQRHRRLGASAEEHHPAHKPLLDPSDARANVGGYDDYPELYTRWFRYAAFLPIFRAQQEQDFE